MTSEERTRVALAYLALNGAVACEGVMKAQIQLDALLGLRGTAERTDALLNAHEAIREAKGA